MQRKFSVFQIHFKQSHILLLALILLVGFIPVNQSVFAETVGVDRITVNTGNTYEVKNDFTNRVRYSNDNAAFLNYGTLNIGEVTITNEAGNHLLVYAYDNAVVNLNGTSIDLETGGTGGPYIYARGNNSVVNMNGVTLTQKGRYEGILLRAGDDNGSKGTINFTGENNFVDINLPNPYGFRNFGSFVVKNGITAISGTALNLRDGGSWTVEEGAFLAFYGPQLTFEKDKSTEPVFVVRSGGVLVYEGAKVDLSTLGSRPFVKVEPGGKLIVNNTEISGAYGSNDSAFIIVEDGELRIENGSKIQNNTNNGTGKIISVTGGKVELKDSEFTNNKLEKTGGAALFAKDGTKITISGGKFSENQANNAGAIRLINGTLTVKDGTEFSANKARETQTYEGGGAIQATNSYVTILSAKFEGNTAPVSGGAICQDGGTLVFGEKGVKGSGPTFSNNTVTREYAGADKYSRSRGGAVAVEIYCDLANDPECVNDENIVPLDMKIFDAVFDSNTAVFQGGALSIGYNGETGGRRGYLNREEVNVEIFNAEFTNNEVKNNQWDGIAGGAIMIFQNGSLRMKKVVMTNNSTNAAGGAIASCNTGVNNIYIYNGAVIYDNTAEWPGTKELDDIFVMNKETNPVISEDMFNGGKHQWKQNEVIRVDGVTHERTTGIYYGSDPTNTSTDGYLVLFENNKAFGYVDKTWKPEGMEDEITDPTMQLAPLNGNGGAIGNNGHLYIGSENPDEPPTPDGPHFFRLDELPKTGFSAARPMSLSVQPKEISYKSQNLMLQIPSLNVMADIVSVPFVDGEYPVEWLDMQAGMLEGSAKPGEGMVVLTGHNTLNSTEAGPFAFLSFMEEGDMIFLLNKYNQLKPFVVYAVEKIGAFDSAALERIASMDEKSLTLLTCEDELTEGGYASRRVVAAKPVGTW